MGAPPSNIADRQRRLIADLDAVAAAVPALDLDELVALLVALEDRLGRPDVPADLEAALVARHRRLVAEVAP